MSTSKTDRCRLHACSRWSCLHIHTPSPLIQHALQKLKHNLHDIKNRNQGYFEDHLTRFKINKLIIFHQRSEQPAPSPPPSLTNIIYTFNRPLNAYTQDPNIKDLKLCQTVPVAPKILNVEKTFGSGVDIVGKRCNISVSGTFARNWKTRDTTLITCSIDPSKLPSLPHPTLIQWNYLRCKYCDSKISRNQSEHLWISISKRDTSFIAA